MILKGSPFGVPLMTEWLTMTAQQDLIQTRGGRTTTTAMSHSTEALPYPGRTAPLQLPGDAVTSPTTTAAALSVQRGAKTTTSRRCALYAAAEHGKSRHVSVLLMLGKDPDRTDSFGITPLQIAAWNNHCKVVQKLSKRSSDVNIADKVGHTALFKAVWKRCAVCVRCLLEAGAVLDARDYSGNSPLLLACELGFQDISEALLEAGASTRLHNHRGDSALHIATSQNHDACVRLLLEHGADPDAKNKSGLTALALVAKAKPSLRSFSIIKSLIVHNSSLELRCKTPSARKVHLTPLELAFCRKNVTVAALLYKAGGDFTRLQRWHAMHMDLLADCGTIMATLRELVSNPRTLKDACRVQIRNMIRRKCAPSDLPLPRLLVDFLELKDVFDYD